MNASAAALYLGLLMLTSAMFRLPGIYRDMMEGVLDIAKLLNTRFEMLSGAMLVLLSSSLPNT